MGNSRTSQKQPQKAVSKEEVNAFQLGVFQLGFTGIFMLILSFIFAVKFPNINYLSFLSILFFNYLLFSRLACFSLWVQDLLVADFNDVFCGDCACIDKTCQIVCIFLIQLEEDIDNVAITAVVFIDCIFVEICCCTCL